MRSVLKRLAGGVIPPLHFGEVVPLRAMLKDLVPDLTGLRAPYKQGSRAVCRARQFVTCNLTETPSSGAIDCTAFDCIR